MKNLPTAFQRSALWTAITAVSITVVGALAIGLVYLGTQVLAYLQPILVPFAVAGVLAYLLEPGVSWLEKRGVKRQPSVLAVFLIFSLALGSLGWWILPKIGDQTANLAKKVPAYSIKARTAVLDFAAKVEKDYGITLPHLPAKTAVPSAQTPAVTTPSKIESSEEANAFDDLLKTLFNLKA